MRSKQDRANLQYLETKRQQIERVILQEEDKLPKKYRNSRQQVMDLLACNLGMAELEGLLEREPEGVVDKIVEILHQQKQ